jgi:hypothetical protein
MGVCQKAFIFELGADIPDRGRRQMLARMFCERKRTDRLTRGDVCLNDRREYLLFAVVEVETALLQHKLIAGGQAHWSIGANLTSKPCHVNNIAL